MQKRHLDRELYFNESTKSSERYYLPFIQNSALISEEEWKGKSVLEIGCGVGGGLLPFAQRGARVVGVDMRSKSIEQAKQSFKEKNCPAEFISGNFFDFKYPEKFDLILIHDVIEHVYNKDAFFEHLISFMSNKSLVFFRFPAWQMPFGGHQQVCKSKLLAMLPYFHLLPKSIYKGILKTFREDKGNIDELMDIKRCATSIEYFNTFLKKYKFTVIKRTLFFINPHYETKFGLKPRVLYPFLGKIPYLRNFFCTSCFFLLKKEDI